MKRFGVLFLLAIFLALPLWAVAATVTIVHSCDSYGEVVPCACIGKRLGGFARRATVIDEIRKTNPNVILADTGNFLFRNARLLSISEPIDKKSAEYVAKGMTLVKYDVANVGPNDLAAGLDFLTRIKGESSFTIISSNVIDKKTGAPVFPSYFIKTVGGVKVGFFGINGGKVSDIPDGASYTYADPVETGNRMVKELSGKADLVVALLATERKTVYDFVTAVKGVDLIITTSNPQPIPVPTPLGGVYLVSADENGRRLGKTIVVVEKTRPYKIKGEIVPVGSLLFRDKTLDRLEKD